jgi:ApaG protein
MRGMVARVGSESVTGGVRVRAIPVYLPQESDPDSRRFVFGYRIRITNEGEQNIKLLSRYWHIVDADGEAATVRGEGVVGQQPELGRGESFEYSSYCPLATPWGTMEGSYTMVHLFDTGKPARGEPFEVAISRFYLVSGVGATQP